MPSIKAFGQPTFATVEEERRHRKERLAAAFRLFARCGFDEGVAGHITARDPERLDHFWVNPFAMHFSQIRVSDLILVNDNGDVVEGDRPVNGAAFAIHSQLHAARPDVVREDNVARLRARLVLEGANIPLTEGAEAMLAAKGVTVVPDFVANAGGVICAAMEYAGATQATAFAAIAERIRANTEAVLSAAKARAIRPRKAALELAERRVRDAMTYRRFSIL